MSDQLSSSSQDLSRLMVGYTNCTYPITILSELSASGLILSNSQFST